MTKSEHSTPEKTVLHKTKDLSWDAGQLEGDMEEMGTPTQVIEPVQNKLVNTVLFAIIGLGFLPLMTTLIEAAKNGIWGRFIPHIVSYIVVGLTILLHNWLSYRIRSCIILGVFFVMGTGAMAASGLIGAGTYFLFVCCMLATILFGVRFGLLTLFACIVSMAIIGLRLHLQEGFFEFDIVAYATNPKIWIIRIFVFGFFGAIIILTLNRLYRTLIEAIETRDRTTSQLKHSREAIRNLSSHMQENIENERKRIARELHDELGQALTYLPMELATLEGHLQNDQGAISNKISSMLELLNQTIVKVNRIVTELRPSVIDDLGLAAAIEWLAEDFQERTGIQITAIMDPPDIFADDNLSIAVFRITQEVLTNVARHAGAKQVKINLQLKDSYLILSIHDNGRGIQQEELNKIGSFGITGIRERVAILGGHFSIQGDSETGTQLQVKLHHKIRKKYDTHFDSR